jgi:NTP pyrophosphatase (non-canonical NTP hydrolase)
LNDKFGPKKKKAGEAEQDLGEELADVLFVLLVIANEQRIDMDGALERVLEKYRLRDSERWVRKPGATP